MKAEAPSMAMAGVYQESLGNSILLKWQQTKTGIHQKIKYL
jgi:hypothetical protein